MDGVPLLDALRPVPDPIVLCAIDRATGDWTPRPTRRYACRVAMVDASDRELEPGDTLGPYRLEEVLGEGGMGLVFKARRDGDDRPVALKVLKRQLSGDLVYQQRFVHEARAAAEVRDPHLVAILESAEWDGRHCLASDYVDGGSLTEHIAVGWPAAARRRGPRHRRGRVRPRRPARRGRHAPRHQAFERPLRQRRNRSAHRLRPREGTGVHRPHQAGTGDGDARLPRAGADPGQAGDGGDRHLRARLRRVRVRRRPGALRRQVRLPGRARPSRGAAAGSRAPSARSCRPGFSAAILTALEKEPERRPATAGAYASLLRTAAERSHAA